MASPEDREFRLAFCKLHVLHRAAQGPIYGLWMLRELAEHGHQLSPGTLYPLFARMEKNGWLRSRAQGSPGEGSVQGNAKATATQSAAGTTPTKERRDYRITPAGRKLLKQLRAEIAELHRELVLGEEPDHPREPRDRS